MEQQTTIKIFEEKKVRTLWDEKNEKWFFSIVDVIEILTSSPRPRKYWNALKTKLKAEGSELSQKMGQLKMEAEDGKMRMTRRKRQLRKSKCSNIAAQGLEQRSRSAIAHTRNQCI